MEGVGCIEGVTGAAVPSLPGAALSVAMVRTEAPSQRRVLRGKHRRTKGVCTGPTRVLLSQAAGQGRRPRVRAKRLVRRC